MITNGNFIQTIVSAVLALCVGGLMTWLGWMTVVIFDHSKEIAKIEYLLRDVENLKHP
jgi:hypothetical protein